jgi:hypothetical protein
MQYRYVQFVQNKERKVARRVAWNDDEGITTQVLQSKPKYAETKEDLGKDGSIEFGTEKKKNKKYGKKSTVFRDVTPYGLVEVYRRFGVVYCLHHQRKSKPRGDLPSYFF